MNLAKNGAVLLAALSVFAMTSCGGNKTMSYKDALKWVSEHYTEDVPGKKVTKTKVTWDYSKNKKNDKKIKGELIMQALTGQEYDLNGVMSLILYSEFDVDITKTTKTTGSETVDGSSRSWDCGTKFNAKKFSDEYGKDENGDDDRVLTSQKFSTKGNTITIVETYKMKQEFASCYVTFTEDETRVIGEDGYTDTLTLRMHDKTATFYSIKEGEFDPISLGQFDANVKMSDFVLKSE